MNRRTRDKNGYLIDNFMSIADPHARIENSAERKLWRTVLLQAVMDTVDADEDVRKEALAYIHSRDVFDTMDRAMIDRSMVGKLRAFVDAGGALSFKNKSFKALAA